MPPFTFNLCQNGNFFGSFHFGFSSCRHFVDSLRRPKAAPTMNLSFSRARGRLYGSLLVTFFLRCRRFDGRLGLIRNLLPMKTS